MKRRMPPLNHLRAFEAAARHESFTRAAEELNVTQGAVSRHVRTLEDYLGFELFERSASGVFLSASSRQFAQELTKAFDHICKASESLEKHQKRTVLLVRGYTNFMTSWLLPRLPAFQVRHPGIEIRLSSGRNDTDDQSEAPDVSIRYGKGHWEGFDAQLLFHDDLVPNCSPSLATRLNRKDPESILGLPVYHSYERRNDWSHWFSLVSQKPFKPLQDIYVEDPAIVRQCVLAGMGVGLFQREYVLDDVKAGRLVIPFDVALRRSPSFYAVCAESKRDTPKVKLFREWLIETIAQERPQPETPATVVNLIQPRANRGTGSGLRSR